jgi:glycogen debranching enzyme
MAAKTQSRAELSGLTAEEKRLAEDRAHQKYWRRWGPYLSERQWGAVREDYSYDGNAWESFTFEQSRSRTYRWGEDGLAGVSDNKQLLCFSVALWNEQDPILKEKLYGLTGPQGNHGEDVKELYYYVDNTPTHSYMKYLYKYPQNRFPYEDLLKTNAERSKLECEYELADTGIFENNEYFDVVFEMAKEDDEELYFRITAYNRSDKPAPLHILPQMFYRNTWSWGHDDYKPSLSQESEGVIKVDHKKFGDGRRIAFAPSPGLTEHHPDVEPQLLFTDNESNLKKLYDQTNKSEYVKDAFHEYIVDENDKSVNPKLEGTKAGAWFVFDDEGGVPPGDYVTIRYKFTKKDVGDFHEHEFDQLFSRRETDADNFYWRITPLPISDELRQIQRQAFAGMLWTKQFYHFIQEDWYHGDPVSPKPPQNRANGRNKEWKHMYIDDVLSFCDKFEYAFFAAWDTAFHCIPLALIDPDFAKKQLDLLTREWYMHPNGQIPAYEWNFSDVNPPVHAWSTFRVYKLERKLYGRTDDEFLERVFQKLLLNFTWWVNRKDQDGKNVFEGGFLGLDNIGIFNRSEPLPTGGTLEQADSTAWMAFFSLQMLNIALELAKKRPVYEDIASKFFEHFLLISDAMTFEGSVKDDTEPTLESLWNEDDQFYYDAIAWDGGRKQQLPIRSLVGLIPLYASLTLEPQLLEKFPSFKKRLDWFIEKRSRVANRNIASMNRKGVGERLLLALVNEDRLKAILSRMLSEEEFLSDYGIRSLSKYHKDHPYSWDVNGVKYEISYLPGESDSGLFGGNSNWRGPIWFPTNFLLVESLQRFFLYYGPTFKVECPTGSGNLMNLAQVAEFIQHRLIKLFTYNDELKKRASHGEYSKASNDEFFKDLVPFYEYFDGDTGRGLGASHQLGWTGLVAKLIHDTGITLSRQSAPNLNSKPSAIDVNDSYFPKSGPFPGKLERRRSTKSFLNLTAEMLELDEEESKTYSINLKSKTSSAALSRVSTTRSDASEDDDRLLFAQIKNAISSYVIHDTDGEGEDDGDNDGFSSDELEAKPE